MANRRMIDTAFYKSEKVASLQLAHRFLFMALIASADDQGRMRAHPALIRSEIYPYDDISLREITDALSAIEAMGGIIVYIDDGKALLQICKWWTYQKPRWAWPSDYPPPPDWTDRLRYRKGNKAVTQNWGDSAPTQGSPPDDNGPIVEPESAQSESTMGTGNPTMETAHAGRPSTSGNTSDSDSDSGSVILDAQNPRPPPHPYLEIRQFWIDQFPDKPKPREGNKTLRQKAQTRLSSAHFRATWKPALIRAASSAFLVESNWFTLGWFLKNDDHYEKCLNGNYDNQVQSRKPDTLNAMEVYQQVAKEEGWDDDDP